MGRNNSDFQDGMKWRVWPLGNVTWHVLDDHMGGGVLSGDKSRLHDEHQRMHAEGQMAAPHQHFWPKGYRYDRMRKEAPNGYGTWASPGKGVSGESSN